MIIVVVYLITVTLLIRTIQLTEEQERTHRTGVRVVWASAIFSILLDLFDLNISLFLGVLSALLLAAVIAAIQVWARITTVQDTANRM
jgi:hypothetical protein